MAVSTWWLLVLASPVALGGREAMDPVALRTALFDSPVDVPLELRRQIAMLETFESQRQLDTAQGEPVWWKTPVGVAEDLRRRSNELLDHLDWSTDDNPLGHSIVTPVRNQGQCGSCWAFVATGTVEGSVAQNTGKLTMLSPQQLVDCDRQQNLGCAGGNPLLSYSFILDNGLAADTEYPYRGRESDCPTTLHRVSTITGFGVVRPLDEHALLEAVNIGPVAVGVCGSSPGFLLYSGGIHDDPNCGQELNHALLLVGYGHDNKTGVDFWIARNSWGVEWGEDGYIRLLRTVQPDPNAPRDSKASVIGPAGICGITLAASVAVGGAGGDPGSPVESHESWLQRWLGKLRSAFVQWINSLPPWLSQLLAGLFGALLALAICGIYVSRERHAYYEPLPDENGNV
uniref:Peptidase C1A papain C-terminal domain-containing protein n=1 Tax=Pinguiococcus pyrenoidosus TaxID=172671 RepID=A0A6U0TSW0_9STRA|mmetsp:Transcript_12852/g.47566  ORF Transcript_12852/g.47566 Transcript_12852/m.47566 type:complete len:401 (+) Transcript_12852:1-1203(+)